MTPQPIPCPEAGYACPGCDRTDKLGYRIAEDDYACGACGLVSTVNEVVDHGRELRQKEIEKENQSFDWLDDYTLPDTRQEAD